jgi:hypothetical protein
VKGCKESTFTGLRGSPTRSNNDRSTSMRTRVAEEQTLTDKVGRQPTRRMNTDKRAYFMSTEWSASAMAVFSSYFIFPQRDTYGRC